MTTNTPLVDTSSMLHLAKEYEKNPTDGEESINTEAWTLPVTDSPLLPFLPFVVPADPLGWDDDDDNQTNISNKGCLSAVMNGSVASHLSAQQSKSQGKEVKQGKRPDDDDKLAKVERRRQRNRESLQRARLRKHKEVEQMKETLKVLEERYQQLSQESQQRRVESENSKGTQRQLQGDYYELADVSHRLQDENYLLEKVLLNKQKLQWSIHQQLEQLTPLNKAEHAKLISDFEYSAISEAQAREQVGRCILQMRAFEETAIPLSLADSDFEEDECPLAAPLRACCTFGWSVSCRFTDENHFFACFSKFFPNVDPQEALLKSWKEYSHPIQRGTPSRHVVRYEILQILGEFGYVAGIDAKHPVKEDKLMRWINLAFRLQTDRGFALIMSPMNLSNPIDQHGRFIGSSDVEFIEAATVIDFIAKHDEASDVQGCLIKWSVLTEYDTQEDMYSRLLNSLHGRVAWENSIVPSALNVAVK